MKRFCPIQDHIEVLLKNTKVDGEMGVLSHWTRVDLHSDSFEACRDERCISRWLSGFFISLSS